MDGKNVQLKKEIKERKMLEEFKKNKNGLNYYIYPKINLGIKEMQYSSNIMIIGEIGIRKSTLLHCICKVLI